MKLLDILLYPIIRPVGWSVVEVLLFPFTELAGWLVMRDMRRWAKIPYTFDTEPFTGRQEGMRRQ